MAIRTPAIRTPTALMAALLSLALAGAGAARAEALGHGLEATRVIDLTHPLYEGMPVWPGAAPFRMTRLVDYDQGYRLHSFAMAENVGTHVDAPSHFAAGTRDIDELGPAELVVPAVVIDVRDKVARDADYRLSARDVRLWEDAHGPVPAGSLVILNTGWHLRFADADRYVNVDSGGIMHFPGFGREAAELLFARGVAGLGIDTLSIDHGPSRDFPVHRLAAGADKIMIENLTNLIALPPVGATVVIGVLKVRGASQAQARILALLP